MKSVVFYTRKRCCLCDDALAVVQAASKVEPFTLEIVDVDADPALVAQYGDKVPVVVVDGFMHAKYRVDPEAFLRRLRSPSGEAQP